MHIVIDKKGGTMFQLLTVVIFLGVFLYTNIQNYIMALPTGKWKRCLRLSSLNNFFLFFLSPFLVFDFLESRKARQRK